MENQNLNENVADDAKNLAEAQGTALIEALGITSSSVLFVRKDFEMTKVHILDSDKPEYGMLAKKALEHGYKEVKF